MAKPSASRRQEAKSAASDNRNLAMAVVDVVRRTNLAMELFVPNRAEVLDMTINAAGKERVGIQCYQAAVLNSSRAVLAWVAKIEQLKRPVKEVWLVGRHVPSEVREWLEPYDAAIVLSSVTVCSLLGVSPNVATIAATALVGGKSVAGALKGILRS